MKAFFDKKKKDIKFKFAGSGKKLTNADTGRAQRVGGTAAGVAAGAAALSRIEHLHRPKAHTPQNAAINHLEKTGAESATAAELECPSVSGVYFTCPLTGATLTVRDREARLKKAILMRFEQDAVEASIMMIHTFNKDIEVKAAVDVISKYVNNVCKHPAEEKYRKIKVSNNIFQEKVLCVEGSREFLQALGFRSTMLPVEGQEGDEEVLVLPEQDEDALHLMAERRDRLQRGKPLRARLERRPQAFRPSPNATHFELPPDFYDLTTEELKKEQQMRSELVERNATLRTRVMREKQEQKDKRKYSYTVLRIRLPDGNLLQGTFYAWERMPAVFNFLRDSLVDSQRRFKLVAPGSHQSLQESENMSLSECSLVPSALLMFSWDTDTQLDATAPGSERKSSALLKPELLESIRTLNPLMAN